MSTLYPVNEEELQNIPGVGAGKAKRYGAEFCKLIKQHCEENDIVRPSDMRVRTVANKSKVKVKIIQAIDRKVSLEDIARSNGLDFDELLDEMEAIVYSGTKLNIDYYLSLTKSTTTSVPATPMTSTPLSTTSTARSMRRMCVWCASSSSANWQTKVKSNIKKKSKHYVIIY